MFNVPILTEITRSNGDNSFSDFELFYRFFGRMPLLSVQAGSTDLYDRPARSIKEALDQLTGDNHDEEKEDPSKGDLELDAKVDEIFAYLAPLNVLDGYMYDRKTHVTGNSHLTIAKFLNFDSNMFIAHIAFLEHDIIARVRVAPGKAETMTSISLLGNDESSPLWQGLVQFSKKFLAPPQIRIDEINIITQSGSDFYLKGIPLVNNKKQNFSYENYNEGFEAISVKVLEALQSDDVANGLVLFHGDPGTGKTSYLKFMLHTISKRKLIYLPPDLIQHLSSPNFVTFLMSQCMNSILLIEDAENVLKQREVGGSQAVSNILNISDGILGDILRLKIVCTFNSPLDQIDSALLRPGRLITEYRFEQLQKDRAVKLMKKLHGDDVIDDPDFERKDMTLAEVFNFQKMPSKTTKKKQKVGFI